MTNMKKLFSFFVATILCVMTTNAQQAVAVLSHDGTSKTFNGYNALQAAYAEAANGDLITLSSGTFGAVANIEKAIKIHGAGMEMDTIYHTGPTMIVGDMRLNITDDGTNRFRLEGVYYYNNIAYMKNQIRPEFIKCRLYNIYGGKYTQQGTTYYGTIKDALFYHCKVMSELVCCENSSATIINSYVGCPHSVNDTTSVFDIRNSVIAYPWSGVCLLSSTISNSVLGSYFTYNQRTTFSNCLLPYNYNPDPSKNTYKNYEKLLEVFETYNNYSESDRDAEDFMLYPAYNSTYGIYSGSFPFSPRLAGPHIQLMEVAPHSTDAGTLNVRIKIQNTTN